MIQKSTETQTKPSRSYSSENFNNIFFLKPFSTDVNRIKRSLLISKIKILNRKIFNWLKNLAHNDQFLPLSCKTKGTHPVNPNGTPCKIYKTKTIPSPRISSFFIVFIQKNIGRSFSIREVFGNFIVIKKN